MQRLSRLERSLDVRRSSGVNWLDQTADLAHSQLGQNTQSNRVLTDIEVSALIIMSWLEWGFSSGSIYCYSSIAAGYYLRCI